MRSARLPPRRSSIADKEDAVGFVDLMDDADVRMLEGSGGGGFLHESLTALGLLDEIRRQDFQRYLAVELLVAGAVDDLQLAPAELFEHRVVRKRFPDHCLDTIPPDWDYGAGSRMFRRLRQGGTGGGVVVVPEEGLEPSQPRGPRDFESREGVVATSPLDARSFPINHLASSLGTLRHDRDRSRHIVAYKWGCVR